MANDKDRGREARLLKQCLMYDYDGNGIQAVAGLLNETYDYVWSQTHERINPHIKVLRAAYIITGDPRLKKELEPDGFELVPKRKATGEVKSMEGEAIDVIIHAAKIMEQIQAVIEDGKVTSEEAAGLRKALNTFEEIGINLRSAIERAERTGKVHKLENCK